jgi:23S rRNA (adenine1618-N6)-methyltransferase
MKTKTNSEKTNLHPRNLHRFGYDFPVLIDVCTELKSFVFVNQYNTQTIDFSNADAVKTLNKALLKKHYGVEHWEIPTQYLCPPIPSRVDYIHHLADLLALNNNAVIPTAVL